MPLLAVCACTSANGGNVPNRADEAPIENLEVATPDWPGESRVDWPAFQMLPAASQLEVEQSPVPALVPPTSDLLEAGIVSTGTHYFAFSGSTPDINFAVHATRASHQHDHVEATDGTREMRGTLGRVTQNEGTWTAAWIEHGCAYTADLECAAAEDPRCLDDTFLLERVEGLVFIGGEGTSGGGQ